MWIRNRLFYLFVGRCNWIFGMPFGIRFMWLPRPDPPGWFDPIPSKLDFWFSVPSKFTPWERDKWPAPKDGLHVNCRDYVFCD